MRNKFSKVLRELRRPIKQLIQLPELVFVRSCSTLFYDLFLSKNKRISLGAQVLGERIALYAIYPPNGMTDSHLKSLAYLDKCGYATVVISNKQIPDEQKVRFRELFNTFIERPNYGYDFGAYRDGILWIKNKLANTSYLALFNDSCLFPIGLYDTNNWLKNAEKSENSIQAVSDNFAINSRGISTFENPHFHYGSYALLLKKELISQNTFLTFWKKINLAFSKNLVVKEGEIRLSRFIINSGLKHDASFSSRRAYNWFHESNNLIELADIYHNLVETPDKYFREKFPRLSEPQNNKLISGNDIKCRLKKITLKHGATYHLSYFNVKYLNSIFIKKRAISSGEIALKLTNLRDLP